MTKWPHDDTESKNAFYGDFQEPGWAEKNMVRMQTPFPMYYEGKLMPKGLYVHRKIVPALTAVFQEIWDKNGHDMVKIKKSGINDWGGCYNPRKIAGSNNWSNHSWGMAVDISPGTNGFNMRTTLSSDVIAAFKRQGALWGGDYHGRKDPMHFEFVSR